MEVLFLESALHDLVWWRKYYPEAFPAGAPNAGDAFMRVVDGLKAMPRMGRRAGAADALEFVIPRTPFSLIYRIEGDVLMILRVWDDRQASKPRV